MIKWQVVVDLPDNLTLAEGIRIKREIETVAKLPTTLKLARVDKWARAKKVGGK